jgi:hypothetical protein
MRLDEDDAVGGREEGGDLLRGALGCQRGLHRGQGWDDDWACGWI